MSAAVYLIVLATAVVILAHCLCVCARLSRRRWQGHKARFAGVSASLALMAGGALGIVLDFAHAPLMLIIGVAGGFIFDRRASL